MIISQFNSLQKNKYMSVYKRMVDERPFEKNVLKVVEETTELNEVLIKLLTKTDELRPPITKLIEEMGDVIFRMRVVATALDIKKEVNDRVIEKEMQILEWLNKSGK